MTPYTFDTSSTQHRFASGYFNNGKNCLGFRTSPIYKRIRVLFASLSLLVASRLGQHHWKRRHRRDQKGTCSVTLTGVELVLSSWIAFVRHSTKPDRYEKAMETTIDMGCGARDSASGRPAETTTTLRSFVQ